MRMRRTRDVLFLTGSYLESCYPVIAECAERKNWQLEIAERFNPPRDWTGDGVLSMLLDAPVMNRFLASLVARRIPVVDLFGIKRREGVGAVIHDNDELGRLAAEHFRERGFRHVAFYAFEWTRQHDERYDSFAKAWGGEAPLRWIWPEEAGRRRGRKALVDWTVRKLQEAPKPVAVYTYNAYNAAFLARVSADAGIAVPHSVAILSSNDMAVYNCRSSMQISGIDRDEERKYRTAADLLDRMMDGTASRDTVISIRPKGVITRRSTDVTAVEDETLRRASTIIAHGISAPFGPAQVASGLGISLRQLNAKAKAELGHSVLDEIVRLRIEEAKRRMLHSDEKLSAIAAETGFCNASYFSKVFRRATGVSPRKWRVQTGRAD